MWGLEKSGGEGRKESSSKLGGGSPNLSTFGALKTSRVTSFKGL
jgi:hypothetical protein